LQTNRDRESAREENSEGTRSLHGKMWGTAFPAPLLNNKLRPFCPCDSQSYFTWLARVQIYFAICVKIK